MTTPAIHIPEDEAIFYENTSAAMADRLARLDRLEQILEIDNSLSLRFLVRTARARNRASFPSPKEQWIAATFDCLSEFDAYSYLAPLGGKTVLQIGGNGFSAVLFLLAGAAEAWLLTPVAGEARVGQELARLCGLTLHCRLGTAEYIPFESASFDAVHASGCAHHFQTEQAFPEIARILRKGGRFSAIDPWRAPLYTWGIRVFGKREPVNCRPLTAERVLPLRHSFPDHTVVQHGTLSRYPLLALQKLGLALPLRFVWPLTRLDDALCSCLGLRRFGSSVAMLATK